MGTEVRALVSKVITEDLDYSHIFLASEAYINKELADLYGVAYNSDKSFDWVKLDHTNRAGIFTSGRFLSYESGADKESTSVTGRGLNVMHNLLCEDLAIPPIPEEAEKIQHELEEKNACKIDILKAVRYQGNCKFCHQSFDSYGILFERYNNFGSYRTSYEEAPHCNLELEETINDVGDVSNVRDMAENLVKSKKIQSCMIKRFKQYSNAALNDQVYKASVNISDYKNFSAQGTVKSLIKDIVLQNNFTQNLLLTK